MSKAIKSLSILTLIAAFNLALASTDNIINKEQELIVKNNGSVIGVISRKELSRINFNNEIFSVQSISGEAEYTVDGKDIYLKSNVDKPLNFFVKTENGNTYKLLLEVSDIPAAQIFVNRNTKLQKDNRKESILYSNLKLNSDLANRISHIIEIALKPRKHLGFSITQSDEWLGEINDISMKLVGHISGKNLKAERISLLNKSDETKTLQLKDYITPQCLAVYLVDKKLLPEEKVTLIRIYEE